MAAAVTVLSECIFCLQDVSPFDAKVVTPDCGHLFHLDCAKPWFVTKGTCPLDIKPITGDCQIYIYVGKWEWDHITFPLLRPDYKNSERAYESDNDTHAHFKFSVTERVCNLYEFLRTQCINPIGSNRKFSLFQDGEVLRRINFTLLEAGFFPNSWNILSYSSVVMF